MNALDISGRRLGASVRPQPVKSSLPRADLPQTFEGRVMHSWAVAGHWLGVLDRALHEAVEAPGALGEAARWQIQGDAKRIRARLALAAGHAMGADMLAVVRVAAAAVELLHEASLVHDDLQDRDTLRRGKNTVWVEYGEALAITLGDWMINQAYDVLLQIETDPPKLRQIARAMSKAVAATVCGQARENVAKSSLTTSPSDYIEMATGKTAPLLSFPLESAALLRDAPSRSSKRSVPVWNALVEPISFGTTSSTCSVRRAEEKPVLTWLKAKLPCRSCFTMRRRTMHRGSK